MSRKRIGSLFVDRGLLSEADTDRVAEYAERSGQRFGDAALEMGLVKRDDLVDLFGNSDAEFFYLDTRYFPETTKFLLTPEEMVRYGALALGTKKHSGLFRSGHSVNIGMLNPADTAALKAVEKLVKERSEAVGIKVFLVLADQFLDALKTVYGKTEDSFNGPVQETLALYLDR